MKPFRMDLDRGVITAINHAGSVSMYVDEPGVYYLANGELATDDVARNSGFEVEADRAKRRKMERLERARAEINAQWEQDKEDIRNETALPAPAPLQDTSPPNPDDGWRKLLDPTV